MPSSKTKPVLIRFIPLIAILFVLGIVFYFRLDTYLSFQAIQTHYQSLMQLTKAHYFGSVALFMGCYILSVATSIPGAVFLTLLAGLLFGIFWGSVYVIISATTGATFLYLAVKTALGDWLASRASGWMDKMRKGFLQNAFSYLMILRLIPLFPFWVVNIVPAVLNVNLGTYVLATFLGIMPGSVVYVSIGNGLGHLLERNQQPDLGVIFSWPILLPLIGLALLSMLPVVYKKYYNHLNNSDKKA